MIITAEKAPCLKRRLSLNYFLFLAFAASFAFFSATLRFASAIICFCSSSAAFCAFMRASSFLSSSLRSFSSLAATFASLSASSCSSDFAGAIATAMFIPSAAAKRTISDIMPALTPPLTLIAESVPSENAVLSAPATAA